MYNVLSNRGRTGALAMVGVAMVGGLVASAVPASANAKSPAPHSSRLMAQRVLPSAVTPAGSQLQTLASQDGSCQIGDVCLYYFSSNLGYGSGYDTAHNDANLVNNHFISAGSGQRSVVTNNAEAVWNRDPRTTVFVCTGANNSGTCGSVGPNVLGNFTSTYSNNVESLNWADSTN